MKSINVTTPVSIANAIELVTGAAHQLSPEFGKTLGGSAVTRQLLADVVASRLNARLARFTSSVNAKAGAK